MTPLLGPKAETQAIFPMPFAIDDASRVVSHEKYSGRIAVELRKAVDAGAGAGGRSE